MKQKNYLVRENLFKEMYNISKEIYGNTAIIRMFCDAYEDVDEFYQILPLIKHTWKLSDKLHARFIKINNFLLK